MAASSRKQRVCVRSVCIRLRVSDVYIYYIYTQYSIHVLYTVPLLPLGLFIVLTRR
jgi:hypothetical protein